MHTSRGDFVISLCRPKIAPQTVNNFVYLSQNHFYDGLTFHRVVAGFVVQGGDPLGNGTGGPAYKLPGREQPFEVAARHAGHGFQPARASAARSSSSPSATRPSSATSGVYNHFGQVTSGMDVIDKIQVGDTMSSIDITAS